MHELALMRDMVEAIEDHLRTKHELRRVRRVVLDVGRVSGVLPDSLQFCFEACVAGSVAEGAALEICEIPGRARCRACGTTIDLSEAYGICSCGSAELEWLSGRELRLKELEVG
jgi:hydrogenase nickel incorporation protein HypA/HybF